MNPFENINIISCQQGPWSILQIEELKRFFWGGAKHVKNQEQGYILYGFTYI